MSPANHDRVQELREQLADWDRQIAEAKRQRAAVAEEYEVAMACARLLGLRHG